VLFRSTVLKPGDNIRTGRNGRVLLVRGEETILVSPNSVIGLPEEKKEGLSTTIIQQAGSILLEVEKRNVKHFSVETPYLAAVVKGTQFRVTVNKYGTSVNVLRGKVEVADFRSGQFALVLPGQSAKVLAQGKYGLSLSGSGTLNTIQQGKARTTSVKRVSIPRAGLLAPRNTPKGQQVRALGKSNHAAKSGVIKTRNFSAALRAGAGHGHSALRINSPIGEVKMNFQKITKGLVRSASVARSASVSSTKKTVWNSGALNPGNGVSNSNSQGNGNGNANGHAKAQATSISGSVNASIGNGNSGNGNNGKGKGKGKNKS